MLRAHGVTRRFRLALLVALGAGFVSLASPQHAAAAASYLYALNAGEASITGFAIGADGSLSSPMTTPDSQAGIPMATSPDGRFLFTSRAHTVSSYSIAGDGSLALVGNTTIAGLPIRVPAVAPDGRHLYWGDQNSGVNILSIAANGALGDMGSVAGNASADRVLVAPNGKHLFYFAGGIFRRQNPSVASYTIGTDGGLAADGTPIDEGGFVPRDGAVSPDGRYVFVADNNSNDGNGGTAGKIETLTVAADGTLSVLGSPGSPTPAQIEPLGAVISRDGTHLYVVGTPGNLNTFSINAAGTVTFDGTTTAPFPVQTVLSPDGSTLYDSNFSNGTVTAFSLANAGAPLQLGQPVQSGGGSGSRPYYLAVASPPSSPSNGAVTDTKGRPIAGAVVKVTGTDSMNKAVSMSATSAVDGSYMFDLKPGTYDLDVTGTLPPKQPPGGVWHTVSCPGTIVAGGKCHVVIDSNQPVGASFRYVLPDFRTENVEVTQGIQKMQWDAPATVTVPGIGPVVGGAYTGLPLVKDVPTVVRVYGSVAPDDYAQPADAIAELHGYSGAAGALRELPGSPLSAAARTLRPTPALPASRTVLDGAYTFTVPKSWTEHGPLTLAAVVNPEVSGKRGTGECTSCAKNNNYALSQIPMKVTRRVTIRPIELTYRYPDRNGRFTTMTAPDLASHFARAGQLLPLAHGNLVVQPYPQAVLDISRQVQIIVHFWRTSRYILNKPDLSDCRADPECADLLTAFELDAITRQVALTHSSASRTYLAAYEPGPAGLTWPNRGLTILGLDHPARALTSTAHELLHLLGFEHASKACGGADKGQIGVDWPPDQRGYIQGVGLDRRPNSGGAGLYKIIAPGIGAAHWYDLMSYCTYGNDAVAWLSTVNWAKFVADDAATGTAADAGGGAGVPNPQAPLPASADPQAPVAASASAGSELTVDASLAPGGHARVLGASGTSGPTTRSLAGSQFHIVALGAHGRVVANIGAAAQRITESPLLMFTATVPARGVTALGLSVGGHLVAKLTKPSPAPTVRLELPHKGPKVIRHAITLRWRARGARHVQLTATVQFQTTAAQGWQTLIAGIATSSYTAATKRFGSAKRVQLRVVIGDGFSTALATTRSIKLSGR